jgi:hypothetical protein
MNILFFKSTTKRNQCLPCNTGNNSWKEKKQMGNLDLNITVYLKTSY